MTNINFIDPGGKNIIFTLNNEQIKEIPVINSMISDCITDNEEEPTPIIINHSIEVVVAIMEFVELCIQNPVDGMSSMNYEEIPQPYKTWIHQYRPVYGGDICPINIFDIINLANMFCMDNLLNLINNYIAYSMIGKSPADVKSFMFNRYRVDREQIDEDSDMYDDR